MRHPIPSLFALAFCLVALPAAAQPGQAPIFEDLLGRLNYHEDAFMDSGMLDFSYLHGAPAGRHGFVFAGTDGHFYFEDGSRARFWGINVAKNSVFQTDEKIDRAVEAISRAGFNLVRIHHVDGVGGLLPEDRAANPDRIDPRALDRVDYWIARLKDAGIYVYLDLLDFRTFFEEERVTNADKLGRAAKPYAVFDNNLIELQQQYARHLLIEHTNPYTGLSYASDPAVAMIEICDENGLYFSRDTWGKLVEPYGSNLRRMFNNWLRDRYGTTENLAEAWTDFEGNRGLLEGEDLGEGTVWLFPEAQFPGRFASADGESSRLQRGRAADRRLFIDDIHREYLRRMKTYLRRRGVRVPITAVLDFNHVADMRTVADSLDFMGTNFYYDHPIWRRGNEWHLPAFHENRNPITDPRTETFVPRMLVSRIWGVPSVVREWNVCWPNEHRAVGMLEAAAYSTLQDLDAVILFTYDLLDGKDHVEFFDVGKDPVRWAMQGLCAKMYLQRDVSPARHSTAMAFSRVDSFYPTWQPMPTEAYKLGWVSRFYTLFFEDDVPRAQPDLLMASGRSASGVYDRNRAILCSNWPTEDLHDHKRDTSLEQKAGYEVATVPGDHGFYTFGGTMYSADDRARFLTDPAFLRADVEARGYRPIGKSADGERCVGFRDVQRDNYVFRRLTAHQKLRCALDGLKQIYDAPVSHEFVETKTYRSDTRQITRDINAGVMTVDAPTVQAIGGRLAAGKTDDLSIRTDTPTGALVWTSFDGKGPGLSHHWVLKLVSAAKNTGQSMVEHYSNAEKTVYRLKDLGDAPITTGARRSSEPTVVTLDGEPVLKIWLQNGLWELVYEAGRYYFTCDTADVKLQLPDLPETVEVNAIGEDDPDTRAENQPLTYRDPFTIMSVTQ